ncbi:SRPBCC family protein [Streptomyces pakalii]|uniref:SRPBCC family protein n=1 Tax=Streptomyces pakalii TaxID=3036494 RepID=A0ABT7D193_9ACTN|nr:SRPBCC family protein [Streptomyces pakalii]MDJ1639565.1 SRPBCC family protein [Streptomyces pakalii]
MSRTRTATAALLTLPLAAAALLAPATAATARPAPSLTCQGKGVDAKALVRARTETVIDAPLSTVWKLQTDVERWPSWQTHVTSMDRLDHGPFRPGAAFRWTTPIPPNPATPATSLDITSTVRQAERGSCIRWTGPAVGEGLHIDGVHVWSFQKVRGGVLVRTEETHTGEQVEANVPYATEILKQGLEAWLDELKAAAEARSCPRG